VRKYNAKLDKAGVPAGDWAVMLETDGSAPKEALIMVEEVLCGVWQIDENTWVIEGECPVRRATRTISHDVVRSWLTISCRCAESRYLADSGPEIREWERSSTHRRQ
jgi:hypothetical protein